METMQNTQALTAMLDTATVWGDQPRAILLRSILRGAIRTGASDDKMERISFLFGTMVALYK